MSMSKIRPALMISAGLLLGDDDDSPVDWLGEESEEDDDSPPLSPTVTKTPLEATSPTSALTEHLGGDVEVSVLLVGGGIGVYEDVNATAPLRRFVGFGPASYLLDNSAKGCGMALRSVLLGERDSNERGEGAGGWSTQTCSRGTSPVCEF